MVERLGGTLHHHDGGFEERGGLLPGLVGRVDLAVFPAHCISHEGALDTKRLCKQLGRAFVVLRGAGLSSAIAMLGDVLRLAATANASTA